MSKRKIIDDLSVSIPGVQKPVEIPVSSDDLRDSCDSDSDFYPGFTIDSVVKMGVTHIFPSFTTRRTIDDTSIPHFDHTHNPTAMHMEQKYSGSTAQHVYPRPTVLPPAFVKELSKPIPSTDDGIQNPLPLFLRLANFYKVTTLSNPKDVVKEHNDLVQAMDNYNSPKVASVRSVSHNASSKSLNDGIRAFLQEEVPIAKDVLIIGAGKGADYSRLCSHHAIVKDSRIVMVEPDKTLSDICLSTCKAHSGKIEVINKTLCEFMRSDGRKFDSIITTNSLHYALCDSTKTQFANGYKLLLNKLKDNGRLIGVLPSYENLVKKPLGFYNDCGLLSVNMKKGPFGTMTTEMCGVIRNEPILPMAHLQLEECLVDVRNAVAYRKDVLSDVSMMTCFNFFVVARYPNVVNVSPLYYGILDRGICAKAQAGETITLTEKVIDPDTVQDLPELMKGSHMTWNDAFNFLFCDHWLITEKIDGVPAIMFSHDGVWHVKQGDRIYTTDVVANGQAVYQIELVSRGKRAYDVYHIYTFSDRPHRINSNLSSIFSRVPGFVFRRAYYPMEWVLLEDFRERFKEGIVFIDPYYDPCVGRADAACYYLKFSPNLDLLLTDGVFQCSLDGSSVSKREDKTIGNSPQRILSMAATMTYASMIALLLARRAAIMNQAFELSFGSFPFQAVFAYPLVVDDSLGRNAYISKVKAGLFVDIQPVEIEDGTLKYVAHGWSRELWELIAPIIDQFMSSHKFKIK